MDKRALPNATAVLVLGILSIITCCFYGLGLVLAVVALVLARKDEKIYRENPELYTNHSNINIGRVLSVIGIVVNAVFLAFMIFILSMTPQERKDFEDNLKVKMEQQQRENEDS